MKNKFKKSPILIAFILGFIIAAALFKYEILDSSFEAAKPFFEDNPVVTTALLIFLLVLALLFALNIIIGWIKGALKIRRMWKRFKRQDQIKKYGYVVYTR